MSPNYKMKTTFLILIFFGAACAEVFLQEYSRGLTQNTKGYYPFVFFINNLNCFPAKTTR